MRANLMLATTALAAICLLTACGKSGAGAPDDAKATAAALTGDAKGAAAANPVCGLFTQAEVATYIGEPVNPGENAAMGTGCQWTAKDDSGSVMVQIVDAQNHNPISGAPDFRELPDVGERGYVANDVGWTAGAVQGPSAIVVTTDGRTSSDATAIALLKETLKRKAR
ncbi:hypothetical protein [uncultured Phenylobacterium sp.]|uniref:hypothetical protein n=1 Tax=uncultured Phenylobacterium sp. TaxID=349273 RepID=UPI0025CCBE4E|nr:hypothetical protein [uncultured Phenylobacterium sp.]